MLAIVAAFLFIGGTCLSVIVIGNMLIDYRREIASVLKGCPMPGSRRAEVARGIGSAPRRVMPIPLAALPVRPQPAVRLVEGLRAHA